jgi:hypothetical protein
MDLKLEVVVVPVTDVDRAKQFYQGRSHTSFASFSDPDGNRWLLPQITERPPGRV